MTTTATPRRDWLSISREFHQAHRTTIEAQIKKLVWSTDPEMPALPGLGIRACIEQLHVPRVSACATNGAITVPDGPERAHYAIYGIEANYSNARVRIYVLDRGSDILPLCNDVWEHA
jgi:hypothetical protein